MSIDQDFVALQAKYAYEVQSNAALHAKATRVLRDLAATLSPTKEPQKK